MNDAYKLVTDRLVEIFDGVRTTDLSEGLSSDVVSVSKGQYSQGSSADKPVLYIRSKRMGVTAEFAGGMSRQERTLILLSGAVHGETQNAANDDAEMLFGNITNILQRHTQDPLWSGGGLGWHHNGDDTNPEDYGELEPEPGVDGCNIHFMILWSCGIRIGTEV